MHENSVRTNTSYTFSSEKVEKSQLVLTLPIVSKVLVLTFLTMISSEKVEKHTILIILPHFHSNKSRVRQTVRPTDRQTGKHCFENIKI